jgi:flagellar biosynthetic protein FliQ
VVSLLVGLVVSIFQAMTQIQEQTLSFIPKFLAIGPDYGYSGPWMLKIMTAYTTNLFTELANYARF